MASEFTEVINVYLGEEFPSSPLNASCSDVRKVSLFFPPPPTSLDPIIVRPQFNPKTIAFSIIYQIELVFWFKYQKMHFCHQDIVVYTVG